MSLISKLFGGSGADKEAVSGTSGSDNDNNIVNGIASSQAGGEDAGCTTTEESARIYAFAKKNASQKNTDRIFGTAESDSYYINSDEVKTFGERIMEFGFDTPAQLEEYLNILWKDDEKMQELIPVIKVAVFKNRDKYDSKYKDLSLYNYTL